MRRCLSLVIISQIPRQQFGVKRNSQALTCSTIGGARYPSLITAQALSRRYCKAIKTDGLKPVRGTKPPTGQHVAASNKIDSLIRDQKYDEAHDLYKQSVDGDTVLSSFAALSLALKWLKDNRTEDARSLVNLASNSPNYKHGPDEERLIVDILTIAATVDDRTEFEWYANTLIWSHACFHTKAPILHSLMQIQLTQRNDIVEASALFRRIAKQTNQTPSADALLVKLIEAKDFGQLKQTTDALASICGETSALYASAFALTSTGYVDEANQIFAHHSKAENAERIDGMIKAKVNDEQFLHSLLAATEHQLPVDGRRKIFEALLIVLGQQKRTEKLEEVLKAMNKENIEPTTQTERINRIARKIDVPIPKRWEQSRSNDRSHERALETLLKDGRCQEANAYYLNAVAKGLQFRSSLLKFLLQHNAEAGLVGSFDDFKASSMLDHTLRRQLMFNEYECRAYIKAGALNKYIEDLRGLIKGARRDNERLKVIVTDIPFALTELMAVPSAYDQLKTMAVELDRMGFRRLIAMLWTHNFLHNTNQKDSADLWAKHLRKQPTVAVRLISETLHKFRHPNRHEKLHEFLGTLDLSKIAPAELGRSYSYRFFYLLNEQRYDDLLAELALATKYIAAEHLQKGLLPRIANAPAEFSAKAMQMLKKSTKK